MQMFATGARDVGTKSAPLADAPFRTHGRGVDPKPGLMDSYMFNQDLMKPDRAWADPSTKIYMNKWNS